MFLQQEPAEVLQEQLSRLHATLRSYAQLSSRPSVSFKEDSSLPVQAFLSQMDVTEDGDLKLVSAAEADLSQLGRTSMVLFLSNLFHPVFIFGHKCASLCPGGNFVFWGALRGSSPVSQLCETLQQAGTSPQQLLVRHLHLHQALGAVTVPQR